METKRMRSHLLAIARVLAVAALMLPLFGQNAAAQIPWAPLVGTWQVTVTLVDCQTQNPLPPPAFHSILTFSLDGTFAEDTSNPGFAVGQRSAGQGVWHPTKKWHVFWAKSVAFINFTTPAVPPANPGFNMGQQIIEQTITFAPKTDTWTAQANITFTDPPQPNESTGTPYRTGCGTATAVRF